MIMRNLKEFIKTGDLANILSNYTPNEIVMKLTFFENMHLALKFYSCKDMEIDEECRERAVDLLQSIRHFFPIEWEADWKNEIFLGDACAITLRTKESYEAYIRASKKIDRLPPFLKANIAGCYYSEEVPPLISKEEAISLVKEALAEQLSEDAIILYRGFIRENITVEEWNKWEELIQKLKGKTERSFDYWPEYLKT